MKPNCQLSEIAEVLRTRQRFVVMSHLRPDGDARGCEVAMAFGLQGLGKAVRVGKREGLRKKFRFLPPSDRVQPPPAEPVEFDVAVVLDTAVENRVGTCHPMVK